MALSLKGWTPAQIHRHLESKFARRVPVLRTVQRIVADLSLKDTSGPWSVVDATPEEAALVLPVLAEVISMSEGVVRSVSKEVAHWIAKLRQLAPDLPLRASYPLAHAYARSVERELATDDLDALIAFAPWRGPGAWAEYEQAATMRWIPRALISWAFATSYRDLLERMGFSRWLIENARSYAELLDWESKLQREGRVEFPEKEGKGHD